MKHTEISHFAHPHKNLKYHHTETPYKCDGCKEIGIGSQYKCGSHTCNFDLHTHCANPSSSTTHPFYPDCLFQFLSRAPGPTARYCNACERIVNGFVYHCISCGFDLHPCCAKLPTKLDDGEIKLYLHKKVASPCHKCGRMGRSWSYRSSCKKYNLHVACVKEMLVDSWRGVYDGSIGSKAYTRINKFGTEIPSLKATLQTHKHKGNKGKAKKCCEVAGLVLQFVVSAVLGDPTTLIAGLVGTLMSM